MSAELARLGAELGCTLDLDAAAYPELRVEFLAMTAAAQRDSGRSRADIVKRCAGRPGKQTVYNYAGAPDYLSFPKPELLQRYLVHCGLAPELVRFAVERCAEIRRRHPEAGKPGPRKQRPSPAESVGHHAPGRSASATTPISGSSEYGMPKGTGLGAPDRPGPWHGLARTCLPRTGFAAVGQQFITLLPPAVYEPFAAEAWQPGARRAADASPHDRFRRWVGSAVRDSGVRISPGRMALRVVRAELESGVRHDDHTAAASLVRRAYAAAGIALHTRAGEQTEAGVQVPLDQAEPGDILIRHDGGLALYAGNGTALLLDTGDPNPQPVQPEHIRTTRRVTWTSVPLESGPAGPRSTEQVVAAYKRAMEAASQLVEVAGRAAVPGLAALRAVDRLVFPHAGTQAWLVRAAFDAIDLPLPTEVRFELPVTAVALRHLAVRAGDIVLTESGLLGIYGERGELVHRGPAGTRTVTELHPAVYAVAWRVSAVPARTGYGLVSAVTMVEHDGVGRLVRIDRPGERRNSRHNRSPETAEVVAMVIEVVEQVTRRGVVLPLSSRELFAAANFRGGVEFSPVTAAWDPRRVPVYPLDACLPTAQLTAPSSAARPSASATAAKLLLPRSGSTQLARWVRRPRPGVA
ncbi:NlpC/P60 family protein [Nocardia brasiliensis]|uniref:NlpC/P60 family protein n=1 Tax=Nocardia brasiliensis TaxID=37326 RepID=UPI002458008D|nr:NlpC/P60 family protein [Nocardia brasiliensis]